jgi:hypothetical protein
MTRLDHAHRSRRVVMIGWPIDTDGRADVRDIDNDLQSRSDEWPQKRSAKRGAT